MAAHDLSCEAHADPVSARLEGNERLENTLALGSVDAAALKDRNPGRSRF